ncbi:hypothetical protein GOV11_01605 [Candidatus Woesearchaeota archaeon]|nr:hypothetical protein [Candidatus Woesearchaeota archaeon]
MAKKARGQAWSMDLVIGVLVFLLAIGIVYTLLNQQAREDVAPLRTEAEVVATKLTQDPTTSVAPGNVLDMDKLYSITAGNKQYEDLQEELGIKNEFCIYLVDEDGNVAHILDPSNPNAPKYTGIGSGTGEVMIAGIECGKAIPP